MSAMLSPAYVITGLPWGRVLTHMLAMSHFLSVLLYEDLLPVLFADCGL